MLFQNIVQNFRIQPKALRSLLYGKERGVTISTISRHIHNMYAKKVSREPMAVLGPFQNSYTTLYSCSLRKKDGAENYRVFLQLYSNRMIDYVISLAGKNDFLICSRNKEPNLTEYGLEIEEKSILYTPIFTIPQKWNESFENAFEDIRNYKYEKGKIVRSIGEQLKWKKEDWDIYLSMRYNIRKSFKVVAREVNLDTKTAMKHFYEKVLPCCVQAHSFFPRGQDQYGEAFVEIVSGCEHDFVRALSLLPTTARVYPLETRILVNFFYENYKDLLHLTDTLQGLSEIGVIKHYLQSAPLKCFYRDGKAP